MNTDVDMDDWQIELQNLLEMFERESTISLRKINRFFVALGRPFDERFRKHFLKQSKVRLKMSFDTILYEQHGENLVQVAPNSSVQIDGNDIVSNTGNNSGLNKHRTIRDNADSLNPSRGNGALLEIKMENNIEAPIEIADSDDEVIREERSETQAADKIGSNQMESNILEQLSNSNENLDVEDVDTELNNQNGVEVEVKREIKVEAEAGTMDLPLIEFDPVKEIERVSVEGGSKDFKSLNNQIQMDSSPNARKQKKNRSTSNIFKCKDCSYATRDKSNFNRHLKIHDASTIKPFKCEYCDYATIHKIDLNRHQRVHGDQKLIGVARDSKDGLYKCTHCTRNFTCFSGLSIHMKNLHGNNQRLYNCVHCLQGFTQETVKDRHEVQCQRLRYECYLCKNYVTVHVGNMQNHMRTHSGERLFQCAICNKGFKQKCNLRKHLNSIHIHSQE